MNTTHCESCERPLPTDSSICPRCELQLRQRETLFLATEELNPNTGSKVCPHCHYSFFPRQLRHLPYPANAPWYRPVLLKPSCPHCAGLLQSSRRDLRNLDSLLVIGLMLLSLLASFWG